jgi:hypothetical protein
LNVVKLTQKTSCFTHHHPDHCSLALLFSLHHIYFRPEIKLVNQKQLHMQTLKQTSVLKFTTFILLSLLAMTALFSCSKENTEVPLAKKPDLIPAISPNASNRTSTVAIPYENTIYVPCANGGEGEYVQLTGFYNLVYTISWTDHGFTMGYHSNYHQVKGVGLSSGERFIASGMGEGQTYGSWVSGHWLSVYHDRMNVISPATRFAVNNTYHVLATPDGDILINLREHEVECN